VSRLVFVHGWATDHVVWKDTAWEIARGAGIDEADVSLIDLPGHGNRLRWDTPDLKPAIAAIDEAIGDAADGSVIGVGWSLGAMALMAHAAGPSKKIKAMVLVGATPCFIAREGFPHGQSKALVRRMIMDVKADPASALSRFYGLNFTGAEAETGATREFVERYKYPGPVECTDGDYNTPPGCYPKFNYRDMTTALEALYKTDIRGVIGNIYQPVLVVHGSSDTVTPIGAGEYLAEKIKGARLDVFEGAGHAPMVTEPERFISSAGRFIEGL